MTEILAFLALAFALGFKHSYDADHLVAVSNLLLRSRSLKRATTMSASWAFGHMLTASVITFVLFSLGAVLLSRYLADLEVLVGIMLLAVGAVALLWEFRVLHRLGPVHEHRHEHAGRSHEHPHLHFRREHGAMFGIGVVHGIASNDELLVLLVAALGGVATVEALLVGVGVFSLGVVLGMIIFGVVLTYPLLRWGRDRVRRVVNVAAAILSIAYGIFILVGFGG